jgi:RND superfamily putative drug exporter
MVNSIEKPRATPSGRRPGGGILIDATIIRGVLAPAAVTILGRWNWWLPDWAARLLRVEPSRPLPVVTPEPIAQTA